MIIAVTLAVLAVLSTVVGVWDKLTSKIRKALILATILIAIAAGSQIIQVIQKQQQLDTIKEQQRVIEDAALLNNSKLVYIDEASGGATKENLAYLVDDSEPNLFVFEYLELEGRYQAHLPKPLDLVDVRPCNERDWKEKGDCPPKLTLTKKLINDLEGTAIDRDGNLYLTTSHSNTKDGEPDPARSLFLRITPEGVVLNVTRKLRDKIKKLFESKLDGKAKNPVKEWVNENDKVEVMQIEGLAVDESGLIYLGFRAPLVDEKYALVLRTSAEQIFRDDPQFESFLLDLKPHDGENYGIVSLEWDSQNRRMLILGNSPKHYTTWPPVIWSWDVKDPKTIQTTEAFHGEIFSLKPSPGSRPAKPEVLLIPKTDRIHLFFDAQGTGGQLGLIREGMNLNRVRKD